MSPAREAACDRERGCITCSDEGVLLRVVGRGMDGLTLCADAEGRMAEVNVDLIDGPRGRSQGVPVRRGAQGRQQAQGMQSVRHCLHHRASDRDLHGVQRGSLRRLLQLRSLLPGTAGGMTSLKHSPPDEREQQVLGRIETARSRPIRFHDSQITMAHGAGGKATRSLIEGLLVPAFGSETLSALADAGVVALGDLGLALTTDSFVVKPIRFPGGSIGELAVNGTVNDLAVAGARPLALTLSLILEEGLSSEVLRAEVEAIARAAREAGVEIVSGDTKVVERGHADSMYICTTGVPPGWDRSIVGPGSPRTRSARATGSSSPGASASTAPPSCWLEVSSSWTPPSNRTPVRCGPRSRRCWGRRGRDFAASAMPPGAEWPRC